MTAIKRKKKTVLRILCGVLLTLAAVIAVISAVFLVRGYRMYRTAIEETPLAEKVASYQNNASYTPLSELPDIYKDAVIAVEDHRFYQHPGIDPIAIGRALWNDIRSWSLKEGGSTITQQLAKNMYFTQERKLERKIAEVFMAFQLEKHYDKDTILELYINGIYYGNGYYCVWDASQGYFGKEPAALSDYEATLLAGLPNAPSVYALNANPELAAQRQEQVVRKMIRYGFLTEEEAGKIIDDQKEAA